MNSTPLAAIAAADEAAIAPDHDGNALLDRMQYRADPLADSAIAHAISSADVLHGTTEDSAIGLAAARQPSWRRLSAITRIFGDWTDNAVLARWPGTDGRADPTLVAALAPYTAASRELPPWADRDRIARGETLFMDYGALSVTLLFCASLPECYVVPDLAAVLHTTGQLEDNAEHRIRATGAMVFPVMMKGGLTSPEGGGLAQIFKVRLIHATIRHLILRKSPEDAMAALAADGRSAQAGVVPPLALPQRLSGAAGMHQALFARGWDVTAEGLPCNQEELAYTLLTFSYVFLRGMRKLGIGFAPADEEAYLHCWNVAGHMLGIERALMADTMEQAETLFARMQARGRADRAARPLSPDPRPDLGRALMSAMQSAIPEGALKSFPVLMTRFLCGPDTARDLGLDEQVSLFSRVLFGGVMGLARIVDGIARLAFPQFSIARFITRLLGYRLTTRLLMDQTRPLKLPGSVQDRAVALMAQWGEDKQAPAWVNRLEDRFTRVGEWRPVDR